MIGEAPLGPDDPIDLLSLRTRTYATLRRASERAKAPWRDGKPIETVGQLAAMSAGDLLDLRGFGQTALDDVMSSLAQHGLELAVDHHFGEPE